MWRERAGNVQHRHLDGVILPRDAQIGAAHIGVDEQRQVSRVHVAGEVHAVHLSQVVVALFGELKQMKRLFVSGARFRILYMVMMNG